MGEKEFNAIPNMLSKHDAMLAIIIPTKKKKKKKVSLTNNKKVG
jgi:hypothetical protein